MDIIQYIETELKKFSEKEFNAVDSLILSKLSYIRFEKIVPSLIDKARPFIDRTLPVRLAELLKAEMFDSMFMNIRSRELHLKFLYALASSPRFRDIRLNFYVNHFDTTTEKQFSAVTFLLNGSTAYIAFRGTDSTFIGWKEDFNMAYISPVPSQEEAVKYLNTVAKRIPRSMKIRIGGHSKGGNLAVYAAIKCAPIVQNRIVSVYNHDGPGFKESMFETSEFLNIKDRIHTSLPESSLVGMLLQHHEDYTVVKSNQRGIKQHDPFSWIIEDNHFSSGCEIKGGAKLRSKTLNEWLNTLSDEKRKLFTNSLFQVLEATEAETLNELSDEWQKSATAMLYALKNIDPETRKFVFQTISELAKMSVKNLIKSKKDTDR